MSVVLLSRIQVLAIHRVVISVVQQHGVVKVKFLTKAESWKTRFEIRAAAISRDQPHWAN